MHKRRERIILTKPLIVTQALHGSVLVLASYAAAFAAAAATPAVVAAEFAGWFVPDQLGQRPYFQPPPTFRHSAHLKITIFFNIAIRKYITVEYCQY
jgi:hypothetical protein